MRQLTIASVQNDNCETCVGPQGQCLATGSFLDSSQQAGALYTVVGFYKHLIHYSANSECNSDPSNTCNGRSWILLFHKEESTTIGHHWSVVNIHS
mmetsp:Transcript_11561/g.71125  ORF Transcript_11561/g.71125 Transcript_11561/m.71125 type:complete len:96 (+) Transcript_11561:2556-2843(+)